MRGRGPLSARGRRWFVLVLGLLGLTPVAAGAEEPFSEADVKAVFLYNFANFVSWPATPEKDPSKPFRYCVLDDEVAPVLEKVLRGESVDGRPMFLQREVTGAGLSACHVLYLGRRSLDSAEPWNLVRQAPAAQVLTVSDLDGFQERGGMVALVRKGRRIHPSINLSVVERSKLRISAKLLNLATIARDPAAGN